MLYIVDTKLKPDGKVEASHPHPVTNKTLEAYVKKVMCKLEEKTNKDWNMFASLVFRVDGFMLKWKLKDSLVPLEKCCVNKIEIFPLASTFTGCGEKHEEIFLTACSMKRFVSFWQGMSTWLISKPTRASMNFLAPICVVIK